MASEIVYIFHWFIYLISFGAFGLLFTKYKKWGAFWIAGLFLAQGLWHGCPVVDLQNYFRVQEGLPPIQNGLLTDRFSSNVDIQILLAFFMSAAASLIVIIDSHE
jgi:hypothetical protein